MYIQKMEQEKVAKERGETKDNRSFFAKYWMYILPVVLVFMMSGAQGEQAQASRWMDSVYISSINIEMIRILYRTTGDYEWMDVLDGIRCRGLIAHLRETLWVHKIS